jgi:hypothetical protein
MAAIDTVSLEGMLSTEYGVSTTSIVWEKGILNYEVEHVPVDFRSAKAGVG